MNDAILQKPFKKVPNRPTASIKRNTFHQNLKRNVGKNLSHIKKDSRNQLHTKKEGIFSSSKSRNPTVILNRRKQSSSSSKNKRQHIHHAEDERKYLKHSSKNNYSFRSRKTKTFVIATGILGALVTVSVLVFSREASYCDYIQRNSSADDLELQMCRQLECPFDSSLCSFSCPLGYEIGSDGCPVSCTCASKSISFEADIEFNEDDVPKLLQLYGVLKDDGGFSLFTSAALNVDLWDHQQKNKRILVPYSVSSTYSRNFVDSIRRGQSIISSVTCIDFIPRTTEIQWLHFGQAHESCHSRVGRQSTLNNGGRSGQIINLHQSRCTRIGTIMHEMKHSLGFKHEHSRPDRDKHLKVNYANIKKGKQHNFNKLRESDVIDINTAYDLDSVMHYGGYSFSISRSRPTLLRLDTGKPTTSQRVRLTDLDILNINRLYKCSGAEQDPNKGFSSGEIGWGLWGPWQGCSGSAEECWYGGASLRIRSCLGGPVQKCRENLKSLPQDFQERECRLLPCRNDWTEWSKWQSCSKSCGGGQSIRQRNSRTKSCPVGKSEVKICNNFACDGSGSWTAWTDVTSCTKTCGTNIVATKKRFCLLSNGKYGLNGAGCIGKQIETKKCRLPACINSISHDKISNDQGSDMFSLTSLIVPLKVCSYKYITYKFVFGDFNGDRRIDVMCGRNNGIFELGYSSAYGVAEDMNWWGSMSFCANAVILSGDLNDDGRDDVLCQDASIRRVYLALSKDGTFVNQPAFETKFCAESNNIPLILDVNGDNRLDILCYHGPDIGYTVLPSIYT